MSSTRPERNSLFRSCITLSCALLLICLFAAVPQISLAERLPIRHYTANEGLAHNRVNRIVCDSLGFLWFCTSNGLSRFDGQNFFTLGLDEGLAFPIFNDFLETRDGNYWTATNGSGVCRFNYSPTGKPYPPGQLQDKAGKLFTVYRIGDTGAGNRVNVLYEDRSGRIWAGTDGGLFVLSDRGPGAFFLAVGLGFPSHPDSLVQVWTIIEDAEGSLWIGTKYGLVRRSGDARMLHYRVRPTSKGTDVVYSLLIDGQERLWVDHEAGLLVVNPLQTAEAGLTDHTLWRSLVESDAIYDPHQPDVGLPAERGEAVWLSITSDANSSAKTVSQFSDGRIYMTSRKKGLIEFDGRRFRTYTIAPEVGEIAGGLAEDVNGNIWIAILHKGVVKIIRSGFITYTETDGLEANMITNIFEDHTGHLYFLGAGWRLHRLVGERITSVRFNLPGHINDADFAPNHGVIKDHKGEWWVATREGLYRFPKVNRFEELASARPLAVFTTRDGLAGNDVTQLFEDSRGDIWIATFAPGRGVLTRWERATGRFHRYSDRDGLPTLNTVTALCEDSGGSLWIGFRDSGMARYREGRFTIFTSRDGLPDGEVRAIHLDRSGRLWVSVTSGRGGLCRVNEPEAERPDFKTYRTQDGLSSNIVGKLTEDLQGRIYVDTINGVDRFDPKTGRIIHYTIADGLSAETLYSVFGDHQGRVWFGTFHGLSRITPGPERLTTPPPVFISRLQIAGVDYPLSVFGESLVEGPELDSNRNQIQIDFFGLSFASGGALTYRYKIEGLDRDWSAPTPQRTVNLRLSPGRYRFLVEAITSDGTRSPAPAQISFTILSPVWQRWWFIAIVAMFAGLLIFLFERYRVARLLELERVRTRIATDLHDDIGASLSRIAILSEVAKQQIEPGRKEIAGTLTEVADSARGLVDSMSDIVWSIDPRKDSLKDVAQRVRRFASDVLEAKQIEWELNLPPGLENIKLAPEVRRHLFLILKEALNNVARHSGCNLARLSLAIMDHRLMAEISDDGCGFDAEALSTTSLGGNGLVNMRKRAAEIGGDIDISSAPGRGTHIRFTFPLRRFP